MNTSAHTEEGKYQNETSKIKHTADTHFVFSLSFAVSVAVFYKKFSTFETKTAAVALALH